MVTIDKLCCLSCNKKATENIFDYEWDFDIENINGRGRRRDELAKSNRKFNVLITAKEMVTNKLQNVFFILTTKIMFHSENFVQKTFFSKIGQTFSVKVSSKIVRKRFSNA